MEKDLNSERMVPSAQLLGIKFDLMTGPDIEKFSQVNVNDSSDLNSVKLGLPNASSECTTCGSTNTRDCEGHFGVIKLPATIYHPYLVNEVVHILNQICPGCKSIKKQTRKDMQIKKKIETLQRLLLKMKFEKLKMPQNQNLLSKVAKVKHLKFSGSNKKWASVENQASCKYCSKNSQNKYWYPAIKFETLLTDSKGKIVSKGKTDSKGKKCVAIVAEINERVPRQFRNKSLSEVLPKDFWDFVPMVSYQHNKSESMDVNKIILSPAQVFYLLKEISKEFIEKFVSRRELIFLSYVPVAPNCQHVVETSHVFSDGPRLSMDKCTKVYRSVVDASRNINEYHQHQQFGFRAAAYIASRVHDCLNISKLHNNSTSAEEQAAYSVKNDKPSCTGLKWVKEVVLSKRSDNTFRVIMIGDPKMKTGEIGLPRDICENLYIAEHVNNHNVKKLKEVCHLHLRSKRELHARRKDKLILIHNSKQLQVGDTFNKPLEDGDIIMVNRNPSVHPHSLLALSVKRLPVKDVVSINPLCCAPLLGDFDGDCLHGFVPQSIGARVELKELLSLDSQLFNYQGGQSLLSLTHDSLTAAHLLMEDEIFLNKHEMQQLNMLCPWNLEFPTVIKAPTIEMPQWTGWQLFSMLLPIDMDFAPASSSFEIRKGDLVPPSGVSSSSSSSSSSQKIISEIFSRMFECYGGKAHEYLFHFQEILCEYLTMRGLSVSLHDIYLASNAYTRTKLINEVSCALEEAKGSFRFSELMLEPMVGFLLKEHDESDDLSHTIDVSNITRTRPMSEASIAKFKDIFRDLQNVVHHYVSADNSLFTMMRAGSKGSLLKLVQQGLCLGLQLSTKTLPFTIPLELSCFAWNEHKAFNRSVSEKDESDFSRGENSYAVIEASFLDGLNPLECFFHALACRANMFSENAQVPGTLTRKIMFHMRDIYVAYDGTVRNSYGQQVVQFSHQSPYEKSRNSQFSIEDSQLSGQPVGSLAACSISEAAYGALDTPVNSLESSPLLNLKKVLECVPGKTSTERTASLVLSNKLRKLNYGFEYGALAVKDHLDKVFFSDVVTSVMIFYAARDIKETKGPKLSPWVSHFHINKERMVKKGIHAQSIVDALSGNYHLFREGKMLPRLFMTCQNCLLDNAKNFEESCILVTAEDYNSPTILDIIRDTVIPVLLQTLIKGFTEFKQVDILWDSHSKPDGELMVKVTMAKSCALRNFWHALQNACIPIMDLIDWGRSHPDGVYDISNAFGIVSAYNYFLRSLKSTISDIGRNIHLEHLLLVSDSLSVTGEFHGLTAKALKQQKAHLSISAPFTEACFSNPEKSFIDAAKQGLADNLQGTVDAVAWGQEAPVGTGGSFTIMYSGKAHIPKPSDNVYETLLSLKSDKPWQTPNADKWWRGAVSNISGSMKTWDGFNFTSEKKTMVRSSSKSDSMPIGSWSSIEAMRSALRRILHQYSIDHHLNEVDKSLVIEALMYHPKKDAKIGCGIKEIKVGCGPYHPETRCFILIRTDGTTEDFSYHKCVNEAARQLSSEFKLTKKSDLYHR